jgi:hypothetical protein
LEVGLPLHPLVGLEEPAVITLDQPVPHLQVDQVEMLAQVPVLTGVPVMVVLQPVDQVVVLLARAVVLVVEVALAILVEVEAQVRQKPLVELVVVEAPALLAA